MAASRQVVVIHMTKDDALVLLDEGQDPEPGWYRIEGLKAIGPYTSENEAVEASCAA